jgi:hypothetical protein
MSNLPLEAKLQAHLSVIQTELHKLRSHETSHDTLAEMYAAFDKDYKQIVFFENQEQEVLGLIATYSSISKGLEALRA